MKSKKSQRYLNYYQKNFQFFSHSIKMSGKSVNFGGKKIDKINFCKNKRLFKMDDTGANKILISKKEPYD